MRFQILCLLNLCLAAAALASAAESPTMLEIHGLAVTPHVQSAEMRYRQATPAEPGVLVQAFLRNASLETLWLDDNLSVRVGERSPSQLLASGEWTWHDTPGAWPGRTLRLPPGALTVWSFNARGTNWQPGARTSLRIGGGGKPLQMDCPLTLDTARVWLSAVTFLGPTNSVQPDALVFHVANETEAPLRLTSCRLWLPASNDTWQALLPREAVTNLERFPADGRAPEDAWPRLLAGTGHLLQPLAHVASRP